MKGRCGLTHNSPGLPTPTSWPASSTSFMSIPSTGLPQLPGGQEERSR